MGFYFGQMKSSNTKAGRFYERIFFMHPSFCALLVLFILSAASIAEAVMVPFAFWKPRCSPPFSASWTPQWGNILHHWSLNGSVGAITNGATVPANIGSDGTATGNGLAYISGKIDTGVSFSGSNYISMGTLANVQNRAQLSIAAWIYPTSVNRYTIAGVENLMKLQYTESTIIRVLASKDGSTWAGAIDSPSTYPLNSWTHVIATYNGSQLALYVNGVSVGSTALTGNLSSSASAFQISGYNGTNENFVGLIDDVAVWDIGLTSDEAMKIYVSQSCTP